MEMMPTVRRVAVLANADSPISKALLDHVQMAANARKIEIKATMVHAATSWTATLRILKRGERRRC